MSTITQELIEMDPVAFPVFNDEDLAKMEDYGEVMAFKKGEKLLEAGTRHYDLIVVLDGSMRAIDVSTEEEI